MILTRLRLRNFRQYRGDHDLRLSDAPDRNVTIVEGPNGAGKSGLFIALNWCLYGEAGGDRGELLHKGLDGDARGFVEVHFRHEGRQYRARRELELVGGREIVGELQLDSLDPGAKVTTLPDPTQRMNSILPSDARRYFFFDGEKIDEMSRPGHEDEVSDAVRSVLKLRVLERAAAHLLQVEKALAKDAREHAAVTDRETELIERTESLNDRIVGFREQRARASASIREKRERLQLVRDRIAELKEVREIARQEELVEARIGLIETERDELLGRMSSGILEAAPTMAVGALVEANRILDEKRARGELPSSIRQHLIDDLVAAGRCLCDRELDAASVDALQRRRQVAVSDELEEAVQLATGRIKALVEDAPRGADGLTAALGRRAELLDQEDVSRRELGEIRERLRSGYSDDVTELGQERDQLEDEIDDLAREVSRCEFEMEALEKQRSEVKLELQRIEASDSEAQRVKRKWELARDAATTAEELLQRFRHHARERIDEATDRVFKSLIWKQGHFDRVEISESYELDVVDRFQRSALRELSAGERQVLSLALIVGIAEVADHEAPLVIDTPFGRISEEVQGHLAERLPATTPQLMLLITDHELAASARKAIEDRVGRDYRLDFDETTSVTTIRELPRG
jgi:DNA sulfur modification protein DndD